jgi:multimeric flavodoxin WrbA
MKEEMKDRKHMILGVSASPRAGRWGNGGNDLVQQIKAIHSEDQLKEFLKQESDFHLQNFIEAGREERISFAEQYKRLRRMGGRRGLSNSEVALAAALWSAKQLGSDIQYVSLSEYFGAAGEKQKRKILKSCIEQADGLIISTPVYFGDRSSLANDFIDFIEGDSHLSQTLKGRPYAGLAVGAKRNGGQETSLIYQIVDMTNLGMLGVGNDSDTTAQYGGTCQAGDVGSAWKDEYGVWTCMGVGRRIADVVRLLYHSKQKNLKSKLRVGFWILQDKNGFAKEKIEELAKQHSISMDAQVLNAIHEHIHPCLACDFCPREIGEDTVYRCTINKDNDLFKKWHHTFSELDAIVPVAYIPEKPLGLESKYQIFTERLRYLRRGDYLFSNLVVCPFVFEEIGSSDSMRLRMLTSMIRHHTIMVRPIVVHLQNYKILNEDHVKSHWKHFLECASRVTVGRLIGAKYDNMSYGYKPTGYVLSAAKEEEDKKLEKRRAFLLNRKRRLENMASERVDSAQ